MKLSTFLQSTVFNTYGYLLVLKLRDELVGYSFKMGALSDYHYN